ncbi:MAG TPA: hypothetical protein VNK23_04255 [Candidatus Dormibacteraeota bacterium]|nr:hypothetical protein [Candidatus Dormibacteraeota bacterium]
MRRVLSAIVMVAMLAIPLALPARTGPCAQSKCSAMCAMILRTARAEGMKHPPCICGMMQDGQQCPGRSQQQAPDFGLNAPMPPTMPSARVAMAVPDSQRRPYIRNSDFLASGFRFELLRPPRA